MTPLIDVVFLLLTFFIITFKITAPEGDFGIKMPQTAGGGIAPAVTLSETVRVRLVADAAGNLADIQVGSNNFGPNPQRLREQIIKLVGTTPTVQERENWEVVIDYDRHLRYQYAMDAISAISGYWSGGQMIPLIDKVYFAE